MGLHEISLPDSRQIPQIGLGLWQVREQADFKRAFQAAVDAGYRHFDTAQAYGNEAWLSAALADSGLKRQDVWITTKVRTETIALGRTTASVCGSLQHLQTDYVDLLLLHFPVPLMRKKAWHELEALKAAGQAKSIGVSNFTIKHLEEMKAYAHEMPAVNQVELHIFLQQPELVEYCQQHNIIIEAYSPLAHARAMDEPAIQAIAVKHGKSYAQVMLRWCVQNGWVVLPKSVTPERIRDNIDIFDFSLDDDDIAQIARLDRNLRTCWDPTYVP